MGKRPHEEIQEKPDPKRKPAIKIISSSLSANPSEQTPPTSESSVNSARASTPEETSNQPSFSELVNHVHRLTDCTRDLQDASEATNNRLNQLSNSLEHLTELLQNQTESTHTSSYPATVNPNVTDSRTIHGNSPQEILANHVSWLSEPFIVHVIS